MVEGVVVAIDGQYVDLPGNCVLLLQENERSKRVLVGLVLSTDTNGASSYIMPIPVRLHRGQELAVEHSGGMSHFVSSGGIAVDPLTVQTRQRRRM